MERAEAIKKLRQMSLPKETMEILESLAPELRESEDERIRKEMVKHFEDALESRQGVSTSEQVKSWLAWLEKQKERKPAEKQDYADLNDLERAIHRGFLAAGVENVPVTIIKETAKDCLVQTGLIRWELPEDFEEAVFNVVNFMSPFSSEDELREISHRFAKQLLSLAKEEVQKSTWSEDDENMLNEILENYKLRIYLGKNEIEWIESLKYRIQLQPKQEWNEEDKEILDDLLDHCNIENATWYNWLKDLPNRFYPQPKPAEWSEFELEFRGEKVKVKRLFFRDDKGREYSTEQDEDVAWYALRAWCEKKGISLYDLYPRAEWSEEDELMRTVVIQTLETFGGRGTTEMQIGWLKSLPLNLKKKNEDTAKLCSNEWSEEDRINLNSVLNHLKEYLTNDAYTYYERWLKSLPERFNLQPKQEWSEEDEKMIRRITGRIESDIQYGNELTKAYGNQEISWLKSLRPSWKPSEDEERLINTTISFLKDFADKGYENAVECIDWLKSKLNEKSIDA